MLLKIATNNRVKRISCMLLCVMLLAGSALTIFAEASVFSQPATQLKAQQGTQKIGLQGEQSGVAQADLSSDGRRMSATSEEFSPAYVPKGSVVAQPQTSTMQTQAQPGQPSSAVLATSGSELPYIPEYWNNNADLLTRTNCYAYGFDRIKYPLTNPSTDFYSMKEADAAAGKPFAMQPGMLSGGSINESGSNLAQLLKSDAAALGLDCKNSDKASAVPKGYYKVALAAATKKDPQTGKTILVDYHMLRQNPDGTWSHKPGTGSVTNLDSNGKVITDPSASYFSVKDASGNPTIVYNDFVGFYALKSYK